MPFLEAALRVIDEHEEFWPLSVRQIHYRLLGPDAPLKHASKPDSTYTNDKKSYKSLCDLLARGRIEGGSMAGDRRRDAARDAEQSLLEYRAISSRSDRGFLRGYLRNRNSLSRTTLRSSPRS